MALEIAIRTALQQPELSGLYHLVAGGETSWHGYACFVLTLARQAGIELKVAAENVIPVPTSAFPLPARRPLNSRLDTRNLQTTFDVHLPLWRTGVARMLDEVMESRQWKVGSGK
ncbi:MAG: sugar nucleotide-binding protein [Nitrospiraceae bacterium]